MKMFLLTLSLASATTFAQTSDSVTATGAQPAAGVSASTANEARAAINRGMDWLIAHQNADGYWSTPDYPALTALPLWALLQGGCTKQDAIDRAAKFIEASVQPDGSICREPAEKKKGGGLCNYNTALCMVALHALGKPELVETVQKARAFVASGQHFGNDVYYGGMGYDAENGNPYADLSNSYMAYEAMKLTENVEDQRKSGEARADLNWEAARQFLAKVQNLPGTNAQPWAGSDDSEKGGFVYDANSSKAGSYTNANGTVRLRSYGTMTYAGLLSLIYADVSKTDDRVASARDWATRHWTLEENPGMGAQGHYYFINVMAKALAAFGQDVVTLPDGTSVNWREEVIKKLLELQKVDADTGTAYWVNDAGRWMESDPVLVTSYSLLALEIALGQ